MKIDEFTIREDGFSKIAVIASEGCTYAMRFALDAVVTEALIRESWKQRSYLWKRWDDDRRCFVA